MVLEDGAGRGEVWFIETPAHFHCKLYFPLHPPWRVEIVGTSSQLHFMRSLFLNVFMIKFHYHFLISTRNSWSGVKILAQGFYTNCSRDWKGELETRAPEQGWARLLTDTDFNTTIVTQGNGVLTMDFINRIYQIITKSWGWSDKYKAYIVIMTTFSIIDISQFKYFSFHWSECNND